MADIFTTNQMIKILEKGLEGTTKRQKVISNNMANADTPGFKRSDVSFENTLKSVIAAQPQAQGLSMKVTNGRHIVPNPDPANYPFLTVSDNSVSYRADGNNVDIEREVVEMNKNSGTHAAITNLISGEFSFIRDAIDTSK